MRRFGVRFFSSYVSVQKTSRNLSSNWLHRERKQVQQPTTDPLQDRTFFRANVGCTKNCPTCDHGLTILPWTVPFWLHLILSPSLLCFLFLLLSASIDQVCVLSFHLKQVPLKSPSPFALTAYTSSPGLALIDTSHSPVPLFQVSRRSSSSVIHPLELELCSSRQVECSCLFSLVA